MRKLSTQEISGKFQALCEASPLATIALDVEGRIASWNPAAEKIFGWAEEEVLGRPLPFVPEDKVAEYERLMARVLEGEAFSGVEVRRQKKNGEPIDIRIFTAPLRDDVGRVNGAMAVIMDVTQHKEAEDRLQHAVSLLQSTLDSTTDGLLIVDLDGKIVSFNRRFVEMWRIPADVIETRQDELALTHVLDQLANPTDFLKKVNELYGDPEAQSFDTLDFKDGRVFERVSSPHRLAGRSIGRLWSFRDVTSRRRVKKALKLSERRYRALAESAEDYIFILDRDGVVTYVNKFAASQLGNTPREIQGRRLSELFPPSIATRMLDNVKEVLREGRPQSIEGMFEFPTRPVWLATRLVPLKLENADLVMGISRDITDEKEAQNALRQSEELYRTLVETSPDGISLLDPETNFLMINRRTAELHGFRDAEEMLATGLTGFDLIAPQDRAAAQQAALAMLEDGLPRKLELMAVKKDGALFPAELTGALVRNPEGSPVFFIAITRDVSERKIIDETLIQNERKLRAIVDTAADAIFSIDSDGNIIFSNQAAEKMFGYAAGELLGKELVSIVPERYRQAHLQGVKRYLHTHETKLIGQEICMEALRSDGTEFPIELSLAAWEAGGSEFFTGVIRDISERREAEEALTKSEERYRMLVETSRDCICNITLDGRFLYMSLSGLRAHGTVLEDVVGRHLSELAEKRYHKLIDRAHKQAGRGEPVNYQYESRTIDGVRWFEGYVTPVRDRAGNVVSLLRLSRDITEQKAGEAALENSVGRIRRTLEGTVNTLASITEKKDPYTSGHQRRVAQIASAIAKEMGLAKEVTAGLATAAALHDIGKIQVPAEILSKPARLTETEFSLIKTHAESGYEILKDIPFEQPVADIVYQHHERLDGSGYPRHLDGEHILLQAKILAVADVVEAISSFRPYRPALGTKKALDEISGRSGELYDPEVVETCLKLFAESKLDLD